MGIRIAIYVVLVLVTMWSSQTLAAGAAAKQFLNGLRGVLATGEKSVLIAKVERVSPELATALRGVEVGSLQYLDHIVAAGPELAAIQSAKAKSLLAVADALNATIASGRGPALARAVGELGVRSGGIDDVARALQAMDEMAIQQIRNTAERAASMRWGELGSPRVRAHVDICDYYAHIEFMCAVKEIIETLDPAMTVDQRKLIYLKKELSRHWTPVDLGFSSAECAIGGNACACFQVVRESAGEVCSRH